MFLLKNKAKKERKESERKKYPVLEKSKRQKTGNTQSQDQMASSLANQGAAQTQYPQGSLEEFLVLDREKQKDTKKKEK